MNILDRKNKITRYFLMIILTVAVLITTFTGTAIAKSLYLASEHHQSLFDAWGINPDGTVVKQATYTLQYSTDPAGIAIDSDSQTIFITSEFSGGVELVDPVTLTYLGVSSGPSNLAGIDVEDLNNVVYTVRRNSDDLYVFDWDPSYEPPPPPSCEDPSRTIFAGGPGTQACHQFDGDQTSCEAAWHMSGAGYPASCFYDAGICSGCGPSNEGAGLCTNTCVPPLPPPSCDDPSRTIFTGGPGTAACHQFDGDQTSCEVAWHLTASLTPASCFFNSSVCSGCGPSNEGAGLCVNTCIPPPPPGPLTLREGYPIDLPSCVGAFGLALDEIRDILWVADTAGNMVRAYDTNTLTEDTSLSFQESHKPVGIAVDRNRNIVYTVSIIGGASVPPGTGSTLLSKYDVAAKMETTVDMGHGGVGVAVDETTGLVYVTGGAYAGDNITIWDTTTTPFTKMQDTGPIGNPAGLAIGNISYNPLHLAKNDVIVGSVYIGSTFTYEITCDNELNPTLDAEDVTILDTLPPELDFVSATHGGVYDSSTHTVLWNIGTIPAGGTGPLIELVVRVNQNAIPGSTINNYATINYTIAGEEGETTVEDDEGSTDPGDEPGTPIGENILVPVDIKPQSCPNPLNVNDNGVLPVAILGTEDFDVTKVDPASVRLEEVAPLRWALEDVVTPFEPYTGKEDCFEDCTTKGPDDFMDLTLKFSEQEVISALGDVSDGDCLVLHLTGNLKEEYGGSPFVGEDVVLILKKGKK